MTTRGVPAWVLAVVLVAAVSSACDSGPAPAPAPTVSTAPRTETPTPSPSSSVSPADAPLRCVDPVGDGVGGVDLTSVDVTVDPDAVRVTWRTTLGLDVVTTSPSVVFLGVDLIRSGPGADQPHVTFLAKATDGVFTTLPFAQRIGLDGGEDNSTVTAVAPAAVDGSSLTATFPADVLDDLGTTWTFSSDLDRNGTVNDECAN